MDTPTFGAILQERDSRDYDLSKVATALPVPAVFRPDHSTLPVYMQGKQPACGAHAGAKLKVILASNSGMYEDNSPRFLWKEIKDVDGFPIEDGTSMYPILSQLSKAGVCGMTFAGNDVNLSLQDYRNLKVTDAMTTSALARKIQNYATIYSPSFQQIKDAIFKFGAVIIQYQCGQNMYKGRNGISSWAEKDILPLSPSNFPMDSGHFVVGVGYDENYIYFSNSWGKAWGVSGDGYFGADYVKWVYAIGTAIDLEQATPAVTKPVFSRDLSYGMTDPDVKALQKVLGVIQTGYFGTLTLAAVIAYQKAQGISPVSGFVGPITRSHLNA